MSTTTQGFQLTEDTSRAYERYLVPVIFAPWGRRLVDVAEIEPDDRVLDLATGTGVVARLAAERMGPSGTVAAIDRNPSMVATCRELATAEGLAVDVHEADVERLPFEDASFDRVLCQFSVMFFPDRAAALNEAARVTTWGGRLALNVFRNTDHARGYEAFALAVDEHVGPEAAAIVRSPFAYDDPEDLRGLLESAGFRDVTLRLDADVERYPSPREMVRMEVASTPLAGVFRDLAPETVEAVIASTERRLERHVDDHGVAFPAEAYVVTATR